ncbi:hypothetical protein P692DRAFT_20881731 [Suillus brevipes Sb2]|nr:hypothetical protein P692DRAFT_20881731 [Suillus brevipes Sb2]
MAAVHGPILPAHPSPFRNAQSVPHSRMGYHPAPLIGQPMTANWTIILHDTIIQPILLTMAAVHGPILPTHPSPFLSIPQCSECAPFQNGLSSCTLGQSLVAARQLIPHCRIVSLRLHPHLHHFGFVFIPTRIISASSSSLTHIVSASSSSLTCIISASSSSPTRIIITSPRC